MYKERKEITHWEIGEKKHTSYIYIYENKYNVCHK